jgi:hypothetical protein
MTSSDDDRARHQVDQRSRQRKAERNFQGTKGAAIDQDSPKLIGG